MEATRLKREEDRIKRLEDEEVSCGHAVIHYYLNFRLSDAELTLKSRTTRMN
jgi:hypothetical protein